MKVDKAITSVNCSLESPNQQKKSCMKNGKEKKQPDQRRGASTTELLIK